MLRSWSKNIAEIDSDILYQTVQLREKNSGLDVIAHELVRRFSLWVSTRRGCHKVDLEKAFESVIKVYLIVLAIRWGCLTSSLSGLESASESHLSLYQYNTGFFQGKWTLHLFIYFA